MLRSVTVDMYVSCDFCHFQLFLQLQVQPITVVESNIVVLNDSLEELDPKFIMSSVRFPLAPLPVPCCMHADRSSHLARATTVHKRKTRTSDDPRESLHQGQHSMCTEHLRFERAV